MSAWPVDVAAGRHSTEPSRYLLAVISSSVVVGCLVFAFVALYGLTKSLAGVAVLVVGIVMVWLLVQLRRIRLLGEAVKVSSASTPDLQRAIDEVRARLDYDKSTDVYITERTPRPIELQSLLGTRIMVVKGEFVADLMAEGRQAELVFLLATYFGALKSRYDRLNVFLTLLGMANVLQFVKPLLNPWYRATVYSGDQLAFLCCRDLKVSLAIAFRSIVGKEMAPHVRASGVVAQAREVRRGTILRMSQLLSPAPHPTNRYLNLLAFAGREVEPQYAEFLGELDPPMASYLEEFRHRHRVTGGNPRLITLADVLGGGLVAAGVVGGLLFAGQVHQVPGTTTGGAGGSLSTSPTSGSSPQVSTSPVGTSTDYDAFMASLPYAFTVTCTDVTDQARADAPASLRVAASCQPIPVGAPAQVYLDAFTDPNDATAVFDQLMGGAAEGKCTDAAPAQQDWSSNGGAGRVGCGTSSDGTAYLAWTDAGAGVVTMAWGRPGQDVEALVRWWNGLPVLTP